MYFDAGRFPEAIDFYQQALKIQPKDVNVSTDLGIAYYYSNDVDKALAQFDRSLAIDPAHAKTLLNIGIVRAFGKQDLKGAAEVWQKILEVAPSSEEARAARQALDGVRSAHPELGIKPQGSS
jgi:tetratricopeptide (TPR) repeat protein